MPQLFSLSLSVLTIVATTHALRLAGLVCGWLECMRRHHIDLLIGRRHMGACCGEYCRHRHRRLWCVRPRWIRCAGAAWRERFSRWIQHMGFLHHWRSAAAGAAASRGAAIARCGGTAHCGCCCATCHRCRLVGTSSSNTCSSARLCYCSSCCGCAGSDASGRGSYIGRHCCLWLGRNRLQRLLLLWRRLLYLLLLLLLQYAR